MSLWKERLKNFKTVVSDVNWNVNDLEILETVAEQHPMRIPEYYYNLIDPRDPDDPIKRLSFPNVFEADLVGDYDTSGESSNTKLPGLQHKYDQTALMLTTSACFMYCRHCFRKRLVGLTTTEIAQRVTEAADYIREHSEITNILLSGGDSFCLNNSQIEDYLKALSDIEHLNFIRFGTRAPVVFPDRILLDDELIEILRVYNQKKRIMVITQFNHPRELTDDAVASIKRLTDIGVVVNNQTVVLKGVNDDPKVMADLLNGLNRVGVNPYYVFHCRPVKAVKTGFQLTLLQTMNLIEESRKYLDGLSKRFKLIMSHPRGKIELIGVMDNHFVFRFHQAKNNSDHDMVFMREVDEEAKWLDNSLNLIR